MTGSTSKDGRVVVLDGYAGEGRYEDGSPGSPIYMSESAAKVAAPRRVELIFVEEDATRFQKLNEVLKAEAGGVSWTALAGSVEDHLDAILETAAGVPFFAFLDPCGLGLPFDDIVTKIYGRPHGNYSPGTEILVNFSAEAVRRIGGRLREPATARGREATLAHMDAVCGDDWWRQMYLNAGSAEEASKQIAQEYFARLIAATGAGGWVIEVRNAAHQQPKYSLVFLTRHPDGLILFGEAASLSQVEWRRAIIEPYSEFDSEIVIQTEEEALARGWINHIKANVTALLGTTPSFIPRKQYGVIFGDAIGLAREKHLRAALKQLLTERVISTPPGTGRKIWDQPIAKA